MKSRFGLKTAKYKANSPIKQAPVRESSAFYFDQSDISKWGDELWAWGEKKKFKPHELAIVLGVVRDALAKSMNLRVDMSDHPSVDVHQ